MPLLTRAATPQDQGFFKHLYASTREAELALTGWDAATRQAFVDLQFTAQQRHHAQAHPHACQSVIEWQGERVGRIWLAQGEQAWHLIDLALLPHAQGQGLGQRCLQTLLDQADAAGLPMHLHVQAQHPARGWYQRLGFVTTHDHGPYLAMAREPRGATP